MTTESKIAAVKDKIGNVLHNPRSTYCNGMALKAVLAESEAQVLFELQNHPAPHVLHIPNSTSHPFLLLQSPAFQGYTANRAILDLLEASPAWIEAYGILQPLVDELAELEIQLAGEVAEKADRHRALIEAEEKALAKAQALALESPEVVKARKALAELDAPAKAKGKSDG